MSRSFKVGYFVGSLATASINRLLAKALVRLAPPQLQMTEIPFKDLPLYSYDYDANYPRSRPRHSRMPLQRSTRCCSSLPNTTAPSLELCRMRSIG